MSRLTQHLTATLVLCGCITANAASPVLAEKYLHATQMPEMLQAQIEGYTTQYSKDQDEGYRQRIHEYLERVMGWGAVKGEYIALVRDTYTDAEINAFLQFMNTPNGRSMKAKNTAFANKLAAISAKRFQEVSADRKEPQDQEIQASDLSISNVEKFQSGDQVYFTGEIKNTSGKTARGVSIEANLFLAEKFVDQYSTYVSGIIPAGGSRLFKISCGCKGIPPAEHDSFKLQVISNY